ncbi:MAG: hypothetical protein QM773_07965 [Hyphomonadaceae bacterium]
MLKRVLANVGGRNGPARLGAWALFAASVGVVLFVILTTAPTRGLWFDEYWTLYLADPQISPEALLYDAHGPVYSLLVRLALTLGLGGAAALITVNLMTTAMLAAAAFWLLYRSHGLHVALAGIGVALGSAAVLTYLLEGRDYAMAQFTCLVLTAAALGQVAQRPTATWQVFAALGAACAALHVFAAIYAGAIGAALVVLGMINKRRRDLAAGLAVGLGACLATFAWALAASEALFSTGVSWISGSLTYTLGQFWYLSKMLAGAPQNALLLAGAIALCLLIRPARPYAILFVVTAAIFFGLPTLVSLVKPMLNGRYLTIAVPSLLVIAATTVVAAAQAGEPRRLRATACGAGGLFFAISLGLAPSVTDRFAAERAAYASDELVAALAPCKDRRVRVMEGIPIIPGRKYLSGRDVLLYSYRSAVPLPDVLFDLSSGPVRDVADYPCSIVAWGEQIVQFPLPFPSTDAALQRLNLTNRDNIPLVVETKNAGFIVRRQ